MGKQADRDRKACGSSAFSITSQKETSQDSAYSRFEGAPGSGKEETQQEEAIEEDRSKQ